MHLDPIGEDAVDIIQGIRPTGMPGNLDPIPGGHLAVDFLLKPLKFVLELNDFFLKFQVLIAGKGLHIFNLAGQFNNRFFEFQHRANE